MSAEKFEELPSEKKMRIINAGLECFGQYGYKKANTDLIVEKAGISKGLLFYYFKNKEAFYLYLCDFCAKVSQEAVDTAEINIITDFFDMLDFGIRTKLKVCANYPYMYNFSQRMVATVYKGNIIKNLIMDCQSYTKYRPNETTGGIFVSWRRKEELPTGA